MKLKAALQKGKGIDEKWHVRKDGSRFWASGLVFPLKDEKGDVQGFTKVARDLTEKKKYEKERLELLQELDLEKKKLKDIFERAPTFMALLHGKDHVFEMVNAAYYQLVGHRNIIGKPVAQALPEVVEQGFIQQLNKTLLHNFRQRLRHGFTNNISVSYKLIVCSINHFKYMIFPM